MYLFHVFEVTLDLFTYLNTQSSQPAQDTNAIILQFMAI